MQIKLKRELPPFQAEGFFIQNSILFNNFYNISQLGEKFNNHSSRFCPLYGEVFLCLNLLRSRFLFLKNSKMKSVLKKVWEKGVPSSLKLRRDKGVSQLVTAASYFEADVSVFSTAPTPFTFIPQ